MPASGVRVSQEASLFSVKAWSELTVKVAGDDSVILDGVPVGTKYKITETAVEGFTTQVAVDGGQPADGSEASGEIKADALKAKAEFINTRDTGKITVSKTVVSDVAADKTEYSFIIQLSEAVTGKFAITGTEDKADFKDGRATIKVEGGKSATIEGLPAGVTYSVEEADVAYMTTEAEDASVTS